MVIIYSNFYLRDFWDLINFMKNKIALLLGVLALGFGSVNFCSAATILADNFNSYTSGDLIGQNGWLADAAHDSAVHLAVQNSVVNEGAEAVAITGSSPSDSGVYKIGNEVADGLMTFYFKATDIDKSRGFIYIGNATYNVIFAVNINQSRAGYVGFWTASGYSTTSDLLDTANAWHYVQIQWRSSDHRARYNVDGGAWTSYQASFSPWTSGGLNRVTFSGNCLSDATLYLDTLQENSAVGKTPVLIVPGLTGTEMKSGNELLWADINRMFRDIGDGFMDSLAFNNDLTPVDSSVMPTSVMRSKFSFDYTEGLINEFQNQGYTENENLFTFPYDWRYGVSGKYGDGKTNSDLLAQKIQDILTQTGATKVDVVAHSMGGLIVKKYVAEHLANPHIGKAVFVGVPNTGAAKAVKVFLQGDNLDIKLLKVPFLSQDEIKKITANFPAVYDLLPSQKYYDIKGSFVTVVDQGSPLNPFDTTTKQLTYGDFSNFITTDHSLNATAMVNAISLHTQSFDDFDLRTAGVDVYAIDGCKAGTIGTITENRYQTVLGRPVTEYMAPKFTPGDDTVPLESSTNLPIDQSHKFYVLSGSHGKLLSQDGSRQQIVNIIAGSTLEVKPSLITQDIANCKLNGKAIYVFSPVAIWATDSAGNQTGVMADGSVVNDIPNADIEIFGDHKFLYLPKGEGQTYNITMHGTGSGTYTLDSQTISANQVQSTEVFSNLPVTANLTGQVNLGNQTTLTVQQDALSQPETILPSATVAGDATQDVVPPVSIATISGIQGQTGFYRSNVNVAINATDDTAGVLALTYRVDGGASQKVFLPATMISVSSEGSHTVSFFATDKAGNNEQEKTITFAIDKIAPEAVIQFDPAVLDLKFTGTDNAGGPVAVSDQDDKITLTDQAGNTTLIQLKGKNRKQAMAAEIQSISYNGVVVDISKNVMKYSWSLDKTKNLAKCNQQIKSRKEYTIEANFDGKITKLSGKDASGSIAKAVNGLALLKVSTNKGDFGWSY